jgi:hypothetical protein
MPIQFQSKNAWGFTSTLPIQNCNTLLGLILSFSLAILRHIIYFLIEIVKEYIYKNSKINVGNTFNYIIVITSSLSCQIDFFPRFSLLFCLEWIEILRFNDSPIEQFCR